MTGAKISIGVSYSVLSRTKSIMVSRSHVCLHIAIDQVDHAWQEIKPCFYEDNKWSDLCMGALPSLSREWNIYMKKNTLQNIVLDIMT